MCVKNRIVPGGFAICGPITLWPGSWEFVFRDCKSSWNRQAKDGRAGNCCPQFSPCASTNKAPSSTDRVWCIWLLSLAGFAFSNGSGVWPCWCLLVLVDKGREASAKWCYLCHPCVQGCPGSCMTEKAHGAPVSSSSLFKGRAVQATPSPCQGTSRLGFVCEKQLLSALHNHCKAQAFGGT